MEVKHFEGNGRMSQAVIHGDTLYLCGQTCRDGGDCAQQTRAVLDKVDAILEKYGSSKKNILTATIYLKDMANFTAMNAVWDAWVVKGCEPARACVQASMAADFIEVEITVTAAVDRV